MWRRMLTVIRKDLRTSRRDSLSTYMVLAPILMAIVLRLVLPLIEGSPYSFAVDAGLAPELVAALEAQGDVHVYADRAAVVERVLRIDDVTGVVASPSGLPEVIVQGNESEAARMVAPTVLDAHAGGRVLPPPTPVHGDRPVGMILAAVAAFSTLLLAGLAIGFTVLEEREHGVVALVAVSPLRFAEHLLAKLLASSVLGLVLAWVGAAVVLDGQVPLGPFLVACLAALPSALLLGLIVAAFAKSQLHAIAMLKSLLFVFSSLPVVGFAVQDTSYAWTVAPFANHWAVQALFVALHQRELDVPSISLAVGLAAPLLLVVVPLLRTRLGLAPAAAR